MAMSDQEEVRFYYKLVRELPEKERVYKEMLKNIRGLKGAEKDKASRKALPYGMEIGGMKETIKSLKKKHKL
ncbi:hypothetical protein HWB79_gp175 [Streptomyces phage LukeCage]|jgi:hypothetical protein|uniref:Uncharacterized protein n=1 Tax=Streptomyces phage LukeCage TaxID=2283304 RepID=A0A345MGF6_9CAUD|nr:hypothetical protein HWB79_gp175 [Streptomyces phage LukeCage]AXH69637.1 hypothetical protein SEA_LUKECAGE_119 [Streptomyces phage LukeCage]